MTKNFWLINSNRSRVKRFSKINQNKDNFYEYMFIDSGRIIGVLGKETPLMTTREELKFYKARYMEKVNRSRLEENQTSLRSLLVTNIVARVSYVNYEIKDVVSR